MKQSIGAVTVLGTLLLSSSVLHSKGQLNKETAQQREKQLYACRGLDPEVFPVETCATIVSQLSPDDELGTVFVGGEFEVLRLKSDGTKGALVLALPPDLRSRVALNGIKQTIRESSWVAEKEPKIPYAVQLQQGKELWSKLRDVFCHYHQLQTYRDLSETVQTCRGVYPLPDEKTMNEEFDGALVLQTNWMTFVNAKNVAREAANNRASQFAQTDPTTTTNCVGDDPDCGAPPKEASSQLHSGHDGTAQTVAVGVKGPDLAQTISFMNKSVQPELSYVVSANHCEVEIMRNRIYDFAIPTNTYLKNTDALGIPHYGFKWLVGTESRLMRFNFKTIDPKSVKSQPTPSPEFVKEHDVDENPSLLKNPDLIVVSFIAANSVKSIETGHLSPLPEGEVSKVLAPVFDKRESMGFIAFESKDRAERFVTAFVHAVELCGGKSSDFEPTPSKP